MIEGGQFDDFFISNVERSDSGNVTKLTFAGGRVTSGYRARLIHKMSDHQGLERAVPRDEVTTSVYGSNNDFYYDRLSSLIDGVNTNILGSYSRRIRAVPLTTAERFSGKKGDLYIEILMKSISGEIFSSRLDALAFLQEEEPDKERIIDALGPSVRTGRRLTWPQALWSLNKYTRKLAQRSTPGAKPVTASDREQQRWNALKQSVGEGRDYEATKLLVGRIGSWRGGDVIRRELGDETSTERLPEPLTPSEKTLLAFWLNERADEMAILYDVNVLSTISDIKGLVEDEDDIEWTHEEGREQALGKAIRIIRSDGFNTIYNNESTSSRALLEKLWILDEGGFGGLEYDLGDNFTDHTAERLGVTAEEYFEEHQLPDAVDFLAQYSPLSTGTV